MLVTTYTSGHIIGGPIVEALEAWRAKSLSLFRLAFLMFCGSWDRKPLLAVTALYFSVYLIHCSFMTTWCYNTVQKSSIRCF